MDRVPKVSVGLPVHNGERFVGQALDALRTQTFEDFEIVVSDNASTDGTAEICREHAARDPRVRYARTQRNLGAAPNFNRVWRLSRGRYFRWAAHDDLVEPTFLERCVEVLDEDPTVVLSHTRVRIVGPQGEPLGEHEYGLRMDSVLASRRFSELLLARGHQCYEVFGLIRAETLAQTNLMGGHPVADRVLLAELALRGRFVEVPEALFLSRDHGERSVRRLYSQLERAPWFDERNRDRVVLPECRALREYGRAVQNARLDPAEAAVCYGALLQWLRRFRKRLRLEVVMAAAAYGRKMTGQAQVQSAGG